MDVSIIIVNYNTKELTRNCLKSVFAQTGDIAFEVIVSDNGSTDGSQEMIRAEFPEVVLIENGANLGFGAANNRALDVAKGKYVFYLNSDTVLLNNAVKMFFDYWENSPEKESIGALGANLLNSNGEVIHSYGIFPSYTTEIKRLLYIFFSIIINFLLIKFTQIHKKRKKLLSVYYGDVDFITGADLFMKNDCFARYDERFFLYFEETDLQYQLYQKGKIRRIIEGPKIVHLEGASNKRDETDINRYISFSSQQIFLSRILYFKKNNKRKYLSVVYILTMMILSLPFFGSKTVEIRKKIKKTMNGN